MGRWKPDARARLQEAAMELYLERGFEQTTVAEIAKQAGLTERTFFRHFTDKREVLFWGSSLLQDTFVGALSTAEPSASPIEALGAGLDAAGAMMEERREGARRRQSIIMANPELQERELIKMATMSTAMAETLRLRGVPEPAASLATDAAIAVFRNGFERWIAPGNEQDLTTLLRDSLAELKAVTNPQH